METEKRGQLIRDAKRQIRAHSRDGVVLRATPATFEVRDLPSIGGFTIEGHAAVFNDLSEDLGWTWDHWRERIAPGAFRSVLKSKPDVRALFNHDPNLVLARTLSGTLELEEDSEGLLFRADVAPTSYALDLRILLDRGDVTQCSFAFRVSADSWKDDPDKDDWLIRTIEEFSELYDVSPVTYPAYPTTDVDLSSTAHDGERNDGNGPSAGERAADDAEVDTQADDAPWRLRAAQRRLALRDRA